MMNLNGISEEDIDHMSESELQELAQELGISTESPSQTKKENNFRFYRELITTKDSSKIGNVREEELGMLPLHVRGYMKLALMAEYLSDEPMPLVKEYMQKQAEIVLATSLSKDAKLVTLFFTQISKTESKQGGSTRFKKGLFGIGKKKEDGEI